MISFILVACGQDLESQTNTVVNDERTNQMEENLNEANLENKEVAEDLKNENEIERTNYPLDELKVHYIDVGQAESTLFQFTYDDKPFTILYDAGDWNKNDVVHYLKAQDITFIDLIIISHPHADHTGQLAEIINT